jgi:phosphoglycerol transferase MdoB-like AlkP superfamily enzyme
MTLMFGYSRRIFKIFGLILLALLFYFLCRIEFLVWNWSLFRNKAFVDLLIAAFVGIRFDLSAVLILSSPSLILSFIPWPKKAQTTWEKSIFFIFCCCHIPFLILNMIDVEFINFVGRRFTAETLFIIGESQGKMIGFLSTYWPSFLINGILLALFMKLSWKFIKTSPLEASKSIWPSELKKNLNYWAGHALICFIALGASVVGIRGGLQLKPISFVNANVFTAPVLNNLVLNSSFTLIKSYGKTSLKNAKYFDQMNVVLGHLNGHLTESSLEGLRPQTPQNIVILILESFGEEYIGPYKGQSFTPFLDQLKNKSLVFKNAYANGRRSIEGIAAIMAGVPALMSEPFISSNFSTNYFLGLGTLLSPHKYSTAFFHGGHNGTMHFDSFMKSSGIENYYGSNEYNNSADDDGTWGIWDEPFLQFAIKKMNSMPEPFLSSVFTISSHHPFKVPDNYKSKLPDGPLEILKTVAYTDMALAKFFESAEKEPWFKNTLFVITADHTSKHYRTEFENDLGDYNVPLILYHPNFKFPKMDTDMIAQQIDILPTVLDFLGIANKEKNYLGSSLFIKGDKQVVNYIDGRYLLFTRDSSLKWTPGSSDPELFPGPQTEKTKAMPDKVLLTQKLKATIQYFNQGMWDNKLYYPNLGI